MAGSSEPIPCLYSLNFDLPPSCLEFCPAFPEYFLVGTYNLRPDEQPADDGEHAISSGGGSAQARNGSIVVCKVVEGTVSVVHTELRNSAVLDLHFQPVPGKQDVCGTVSSTGSLDIFRFQASMNGPELPLSFNTIRISGLGEDVLFLSFTWHPIIEDVVAISTSLGGIHILRVDPSYNASQSTDMAVVSHTLEAWCVAISPTIPPPEDLGMEETTLFNLFTGGDDSTLRYLGFGLSPDAKGDTGVLQVHIPFSPVTVRGHDAGVTALLPLPIAGPEPNSSLLVTGSYDDRLRVYSVAPLHQTAGVRRAVLLAEADLGGGVWRLRLVRTMSGDRDGSWRAWILASCMHAGARVVELRGRAAGNECAVEVVGRFEKHRSMNYASDFQPGDQGGEVVCVSTSFYDKLLCLWKVTDSNVQ